MDRVHTTAALYERRERVFLIFAGIFLGCMTMLNILGITRFVHIGPLALAVGVLPYPLTFLCTDFISEFYGRRRANFVVWVGFLLNIIVIAFLWLGNQLPAMELRTDLQRLTVVRYRPIRDPESGEVLKHPDTGLPLEEFVVVTGRDADGREIMERITEPVMRPLTREESSEPVVNPLTGHAVTILVDEPTGQPIVAEEELYPRIYLSTKAAVLASMLAYLAAQFCDVSLFHFWKRVTKGKHLWLRNNGSTMVSQLIDATAVIFVTFGAKWYAGEMAFRSIAVLIGSNYLYKVTVAALDTIPFYIGVKYPSRYLQIDPTQEHEAASERPAG